jgi:hypothetical protein
MTTEREMEEEHKNQERHGRLDAEKGKKCKTEKDEIGKGST